MGEAVVELMRARGLLGNFIVRDISVRYKGSVLGIAWSLLNPLLMMAVYTVVFSEINKVTLPDGHYPIFFLAGFLAWGFFGACLQVGTMSLLQHGSLISKVYFPREVLPLSMVIANLVNLGISLALFLPVVIWFQGASIPGLLVLVVVTAAFTAMCAGLTMVLSALVVYFRDIEFLLGIVLMAMFFLTPIAYPSDLVKGRLHTILLLNPVAPYVRAYQDVLYSASVPPFGLVAVCVVLGVAVLGIGYPVFKRLARNLAEEL